MLSNKSTTLNDSALQEVRILKNIDHPHIIKYIEGFLQEDVLNIVMEFADKGTLTNQTSVITTSEANVWKFFGHMTSALKFIHSKGIIHRDLKPDNILCKTGYSGQLNFKIADFGIAKCVNENIQNQHYANTFCGTYCYMAPEVLNRQPYKTNADLWSLGAVMSFVCNDGVHLFRTVRETRGWEGGKSTLPKKYSIELRQTVADLMHPDYKQRPSAENILKWINEKDLQH